MSYDQARRRQGGPAHEKYLVAKAIWIAIWIAIRIVLWKVFWKGESVDDGQAAD
jgi:hypothetical protein